MTANPLKRPGTYLDDSPERVLYEERHSATGLPVLATFWSGVGLALLGVLLALTGGSPAFSVVAVMGAIVAAFAALFFVALRPIGIRITTRRVTVGALAFADGRDVAGTRRDGTVPSRRWVYSCGWEGVRSIVIATGGGEAKRLLTEANGGIRPYATGLLADRPSTPLGLLVVPGARTVLAVRVDPACAEYPRARQRKGRRYTESPVLGVPTRHPEKLRQALASFPAAARITDEIAYTAEPRPY